MNKKMMYLIGVIAVLSIFTVSAVIVSYLGNKATTQVNVESPLELGVASTETGEFSDTLDLGQVYAYETITFYIQVENLADVRIENSKIRTLVSNDLSNVDCADITSVKFTDYWCHGYDSVKNTALEAGDAPCPEQEVSGLCVDNGNKIMFDVPSDYLAGQLTVYPVSVTFGNVAPTGYSFETQPVLP